MGGKGEQAQNLIQKPQSMADQEAGMAYASGSPTLGLLNKYGQGQMSLQDAISQGMGGAHGGPESQGFMNALASNPLSGSRLATDQVQSNDILGQLFGQGGELNQAVGKEQELQNQGFKLQPQDVEAYGQASGNIARLFGQGENQLSQSLANRGLSQAPSGAAGAQFSGLLGNKNEQLAKAQMDIANTRMQNTMQRIGQQQQFINSLGGQARGAIQDQFGRNMAGVENQQGQQQQNTKNAFTQQGMAQDQANKGFEQEQASKGPGFGDILGAAGGGLLGSMTGGFGSALGSAAGKAAGGLFGGGAKKSTDGK